MYGDLIKRRPKVCLFGDLIIDNYVYGIVDRISPEAPVPVLEKGSEDIFIGGAGLVGSAMRALGSEVILFSVVGNDKESQIAKRMLSAAGIKSEVQKEEGRSTTIKTRYIATHPYFQTIVRVDTESRHKVNRDTESKIIEAFKRHSKSSDMVVISDYDKGFMTRNIIKSVIEDSKAADVPLIVDTKQSYDLYIGSDYMAPNSKELCLMFSTKNTNEDSTINELGKRLLAHTGSKIIVKRSEKGCTVFDGNKVQNFHTVAREIVNVTGAGDVFVATVSVALASGKGISEAVRLANKASAIAISKRHPCLSRGEIKV